jgi:hypothetical protein
MIDIKFQRPIPIVLKNQTIRYIANEKNILSLNVYFTFYLW